MSSLAVFAKAAVSAKAAGLAKATVWLRLHPKRDARVKRRMTESLIGETSLFGQLANGGFQVHPAVGTEEREHGRFNGGYIVANYGSRDGETIDAIQLEVGKNLRTFSKRPKTSKQIAAAIVSFAETYLRVRESNDESPKASPAMTGQP